MLQIVDNSIRKFVLDEDNIEAFKILVRQLEDFNDTAASWSNNFGKHL